MDDFSFQRQPNPANPRELKPNYRKSGARRDIVIIILWIFCCFEGTVSLDVSHMGQTTEVDEVILEAHKALLGNVYNNTIAFTSWYPAILVQSQHKHS